LRSGTGVDINIACASGAFNLELDQVDKKVGGIGDSEMENSKEGQLLGIGDTTERGTNATADEDAL
jgi:hypothetical protein